MGFQMNTLISSDEDINNASMPDHTSNVILVTPKSKFVWHDEVIMTIRNKGRNLGLDISWVSKDYDSNIIGCHSNVILPDEGSNKVSKPDIDTDYRLNLYITQ